MLRRSRFKTISKVLILFLLVNNVTIPVSIIKADDNPQTISSQGSIIAASVPLPPPINHNLVLETTEINEQSFNLGSIYIEGESQGVPNTVTLNEGTYNIEYLPQSGYVFEQWDIQDGVSTIAQFNSL